MDLGQTVVAAIVMLFPVVVAAHIASGPVARARLERFARRQLLVVTPDNGDLVIRYLATTRRWRVAGVTAGILVGSTIAAEHASFAVEPPSDTVTSIRGVAYLIMFAGWFLGALLAEGRVTHLAHGPVRSASLLPRRPGSYLGRFSWSLVPATAVLAVLVAGGSVIADRTGAAYPGWPAWCWFVVALGVAGAVRAIQYAVLRRPQPLAAPDVLAADDAIRSRSLHVLAGGGAAVVLLCVWGQLDSIHSTGDLLNLVRGAAGVGVFLVAALAWNVATAVWPPRRVDPVEAAT